MKSYQPLLGALILALTLLSAVPVAAAGSVAIKPDPVVDPRILIKAVDLKAGTVVFKYMRDAKQAPHTYKIDDFTVLKVDNQTAKIDKVKTGMQVREYTERDGDTLDTVSVGVADLPPIQPKK